MFAGQLHLSEVFDYLLADAHGQYPEELILTGGSAGGIGTIMNADWLAARLPLTTQLRLHLLACTCPVKRTRDLVDAMRLLHVCPAASL